MTVQILDENDNKPIFDRENFYFEIREDSLSDTMANPTGVKVIATDADIGMNAEIKYTQLESGGEYFKESTELIYVVEIREGGLWC